MFYALGKFNRRVVITIITELNKAMVRLCMLSFDI